MTSPETTDPVVEEPVVVNDPADDSASSEPAVEEPAPVDDPVTVVDESASDAELRAWAKDNGVEDVPTSGRLSAAWRETILTAMAAALDPKEEASAEATSTPEVSTSSDTVTEEIPTTETVSTPDGESTSVPTEEPVSEDEEPGDPRLDMPEFETGEYRSVYKAPDTFVTTQAFTA